MPTTREVAPRAGSAAGLLKQLRADREARETAERALLTDAVAWAVMHPAESIADAATYVLRHAGDTGIPVAGVGAPLVAEFSVAEFAAALGVSTESGKNVLGEALELRYRLPRLWAGAMSGEIPVWRARLVARDTQHLHASAAAFVDAQAAAVGARVSPGQLRRLVEEAIGRFMPEEAQEILDASWDSRHVSFDHEQITFVGTTRMEAELELADAWVLDQAIAAGAAQLAAAGSGDSLDGRRATALGQLARGEAALEWPAPGDAGEQPARDREPADHHRERVVLYVHLAESAITGGRDGIEIARVDNVRRAILADQVRAWCGAPGAQVVVKPIIDLADHVRVDQWEIPDRIAERVMLRDGSCVFPWCTRPARSCRVVGDRDFGCDLDHRIAHADGGATCPCNLAPLCRRHHRLKTHGGWTYVSPEPGTYFWSSPHGIRYRRDHTGTVDLTERSDLTVRCDHTGAVDVTGYDSRAPLPDP